MVGIMASARIRGNHVDFGCERILIASCQFIAVSFIPCVSPLPLSFRLSNDGERQHFLCRLPFFHSFVWVILSAQMPLLWRTHSFDGGDGGGGEKTKDLQLFYYMCVHRCTAYAKVTQQKWNQPSADQTKDITWHCFCCSTTMQMSYAFPHKHGCE